MDNKNNQTLYSEIINKEILDQLPRVLGEEKSRRILERGTLTEEEAKEIAATPEAPSDLLALIAKTTDYEDLYTIRRALISNPKTPVHVSKSLIAYLNKHDLIQLLDSKNVPFSLKNIVLEYLRNKLPEIPAGEKISLARKAPRNLLRLLLYDEDIMVFEASLWNPKLTEGDLLVLLQKKREHSRLLSVIASHPKWKNRYPVKLALVRNPSTPVDVSLRFIPQLLLQDLVSLNNIPALNRRIRESVKEFIALKKHKKNY